MKEKLAFVIHRFGEGIIGGSENLCKNYISLLKDKYDIDILTTTAINHLTWENYYKPGIEKKSDFNIFRFKIDKSRNSKFFKLFNFLLFKTDYTILDELEFIKLQGPYSKDLLYYIKSKANEYKYFLFFTYLYFNTFFGAQIVSDKAILVPTAHEEPMIHFSIYKSLFRSPKGMIFLTESEKQLIHKIMKNSYIKNKVVGMEINPLINKKEIKIKPLKYKYILYTGRIEEAKGCDKLIYYFTRYLKETKTNLKLIFIGKKEMYVPGSKNIIYLGRLSDADKNLITKNAEVLIQPSQFESFSISTLEAMYYGVPVLVNRLAGPLYEHVKSSKAGFAYSNYDEFKVYLNILLKNKTLYKTMSVRAKKYVRQKYSRKKVYTNLHSFLTSLK